MLIITAFLNVLQPVRDILERFWVCDIKYYDESMCSSVVCFSDGVKPFLSCSIPNLKSDIFLTDVNIFFLEVDSNCRDVILREVVINILIDERCFADSCIADD